MLRPSKPNRHRHERGAALVTVALGATALALFMVLAANVGMMVHERTRLQAAADASALAGAWALDYGNPVAIAAAKDYAQKNGFTLQSPDVSVVNSTHVRVRLTRPVGLLLGDWMDKKNVTIGASSTAQFLWVSRGLRPMGYSDQVFQYNQPYVIKQSDKGLNGIVLNLDGNGASVFEETFKYGSKTTYHVNDVVGVKSNGNDNMTGPTQSAFKFLMDKNPTGTYAQARQNPDQDPRVVTMALVAEKDKKSVRIVGFARFFLVSEKNGDVTAMFIDKLPANTDLAGTKYHAKLKLVP